MFEPGESSLNLESMIRSQPKNPVGPENRRPHDGIKPVMSEQRGSGVDPLFTRRIDYPGGSGAANDRDRAAIHSTKRIHGLDRRRQSHPDRGSPSRPPAG